jgi:hypothetical protein
MSEIDKVLRLALKQLDPSGEQTLITGRKLSAKRATRRRGSHCDRVRRASRGSSASTRSWLMAIAPPCSSDRSDHKGATRPGGLDCGTGHTYAFEKNGSGSSRPRASQTAEAERGCGASPRRREEGRRRTQELQFAGFRPPPTINYRLCSPSRPFPPTPQASTPAHALQPASRQRNRDCGSLSAARA